MRESGCLEDYQLGSYRVRITKFPHLDFAEHPFHALG